MIVFGGVLLIMFFLFVRWRLGKANAQRLQNDANQAQRQPFTEWSARMPVYSRHSRRGVRRNRKGNWGF